MDKVTERLTTVFLAIMVLLLAFFAWNVVRPTMLDERRLQAVQGALNTINSQVRASNDKVTSLERQINLIDKELREVKNAE